MEIFIKGAFVEAAFKFLQPNNPQPSAAIPQKAAKKVTKNE